MFEQISFKTLAIALAAGALVVLGIAIIIYVAIARDRIAPTPTPATPDVAEGTPTIDLTGTPEADGTARPQATVVGTVREYSPGALIIVISPREGDVEQVIVAETLEVTWSTGERATPRDIVPGQTIYAEGSLDPLGRMIAQQIVITRDGRATTTPSVQPQVTETPTGTPTPEIPTGAWLGEYYDNPTLGGSPVLVQQDREIEFDWGAGSPVDKIPSDRFSVRWRGHFDFEESEYRFYAYSDDGVRVWIDGELVIDAWRDQQATLSHGDIALSAGKHTVQVEYYENVDNAQIRVWWEDRGLFPEWRGEYFSNPDLAGVPALVRNDSEVRFEWDLNASAPEVPADGFSVRWTRRMNFEEGAYRFLARADDGVRVWVDGILIIDRWHQATGETYTGHIRLDGGSHDVCIEYFDFRSHASIHAWWERITEFQGWRGEYFTNPSLTGNPMFLRNDENVHFDWEASAPAPNMPADNFSVRWTRTVRLERGRYRFWAIADDGVRLYVNNERIIDEWRDSGAELYEGEVSLDTGEHEIRVEYYERGDHAVIQVGWGVLQTPTPSPTAPRTPAPPTATPVPPTATPKPTETPVPPTATPEPTVTSEPTATSKPSATETVSETPDQEPEQTPTPDEDDNDD